MRDLHFPTPVYVFQHNDPLLNVQLEKDIVDWSNKDKGITRTNIQGWHSETDMHKRPEYKRLVDNLYEAQHIIYKEEHFPMASYHIQLKQ